MAESAEYRTIVSCTKQLETTFRSIDRDLVHSLHCEGFITQEVRDDVLNPRSMLNDHQKAGQVVTGIRNKVEQSANSYYMLLNNFCRSGKQYEGIMSILDEEYKRQGEFVTFSLYRSFCGWVRVGTGSLYGYGEEASFCC